MNLPPEQKEMWPEIWKWKGGEKTADPEKEELNILTCLKLNTSKGLCTFSILNFLVDNRRLVWIPKFFPKSTSEDWTGPSQKIMTGGPWWWNALGQRGEQPFGSTCPSSLLPHPPQGHPRHTHIYTMASLCFFLFFFLNIFIYLWETESMSRGGEESEGDTESKAGSRFWDVSTEPDVALEPMNHEIMT